MTIRPQVHRWMAASSFQKSSSLDLEQALLLGGSGGTFLGAAVSGDKALRELRKALAHTKAGAKSALLSLGLGSAGVLLAATAIRRARRASGEDSPRAAAPQTRLIEATRPPLLRPHRPFHYDA